MEGKASCLSLPQVSFINRGADGTRISVGLVHLATRLFFCGEASLIGAGNWIAFNVSEFTRRGPAGPPDELNLLVFFFKDPLNVISLYFFLFR
jgi:hypothetical protein